MVGFGRRHRASTRSHNACALPGFLLNHRLMLRPLALALCVALLTVPVGTQPRKLKVHISVDMEGIAGVVTGDQLGPTGFEYGRFREFMTREALAAVTGGEAGATEIVVADSHGNGENLLIEQFPPDVRIVRSWPRKLGMMAGIDEAFDAAIFIGYHASTTTPPASGPTPFSSANLTRVALNGVDVTEGVLERRHRGALQRAGRDGLRRRCRGRRGAEGDSARSRGPRSRRRSASTPQNDDAAGGADADCRPRQERTGTPRELKPYKPSGPIIVDVSFKHYLPAEVLSYLPLFERNGFARGALPREGHGRGDLDHGVHRRVSFRSQPLGAVGSEVRTEKCEVGSER